MYDVLDYRVDDLMSAPPVVIGPARTIGEAERIFEKHDFNGLPVVDETGALVGLLTKLDVLRAFRSTPDRMFPAYEEIMERPVSEVMTRDVRTVTPRAPLVRVVEKMLDAGVKSFPVLDGDALVGVIAREDLLRGLRQATRGERPWRARNDSDAT